MGLLLHISDLHLGKNTEVELNRIRTLADIINREHLDIKHVIFTGDIVDARIIVASTLKKVEADYPKLFSKFSLIDSNGAIDENLAVIEAAESKVIAKYNEYLKKIAIEKAGYAANIINDFLKDINVERTRFISCCGNHDKLRFLGRDNTFDCGADRKVKEELFEDEYAPYNEFCKKVNYNLNYKSQVYKCDEICYILANSNWKTPYNRETNNSCINCDALCKVFDSVQNDMNYNKMTTFFLSHKPFDDICENAKYAYKENDEYITVKNLVQLSTVMSLCGDKHSYIVEISDKHSEFMCGLPLCCEGVHYNLIDYSEAKGVSSSSFLMYNNCWKIVPVEECINEAYDICKKYIKDFAIELLNKRTTVAGSWNKLFEDFDIAFKTKRFELIANMFRECATLYDFKHDKIPYEEENIFEDVLRLISASSNRRALCVKGMPGTGKSTFLSIEYIYFLRRFHSGNIKYIPFYFDVDILTKQNSSLFKSFADVSKIIQWYQQKFDEFLNEVLKVCSKYKLSPCIIIDGLDTTNMLTYSGHTIEYYFYKILEEKVKPLNGKYIMGFNTYLNSMHEKSFEQEDKFDFVCFLNKVYIIPYKNREHYTNFISSYLKLTRNAKLEEIDRFYSILKKLRTISVDLDYIHRLDMLLEDNVDKNDSWKVMKRKLELTSKRVEEAFGESHREILYRAAYLLFYRGNTYQSILNDKTMEELTYLEFLKIRNNPEITSFLIARQYIQELKHYANNKECIDEDSILNCFISRDVSVIIRLQIEDLSIQAQMFKKLVNAHREELHGYFISFLLYLLGHNRNYNGLHVIKANNLKLYDENLFLDNCIKRSYALAEIVSEDDKKQSTKSNVFLLKLMTDENFRLFNRIYQLWYYEDIKDPDEGKCGVFEIAKKIGKGLDFQNCFLFLVSKIDYSFEHNEPYPLLEIDLFTLCDFTYSRMQNFRPDSLFYSASYNNEGNSVSASVLKRVIDIIDNYFRRYSNCDQSRNLSGSVQMYFEMVRNIFEKALKKIINSPGLDIKKPFVSQALDYSKVISLCELPRVGWNITKTKTIYKADIPRYEVAVKRRQQGKKSTVFETIGQHILESVYIAELFLPNDIHEAGYDKSKVISMILMSEMGKIAVGHDYTPDFSSASKLLMPQECTGRKQFLIQGAFDGYADLMNLYDAMQIMGESLSAYQDINMRICQEIKLIQMEYKFYSLKEQLEFEEIRENDFKREFVGIITPICKEIREMLVTNNPAFRKAFEK